MNISYSKIRHIQESNQRLERRLISERVISEEVQMAQSKKMAMAAKLKVDSCWDAKKYPNTSKALTGLLLAGGSTVLYGTAAVASFAGAAALASTGVGVPVALVLMVGADILLTAALVEGITVLINGNQTKNEIKKLSSCLWSEFDLSYIF